MFVEKKCAVFLDEMPLIEEILDQLRLAVYPTIYKVLEICQVVQDFFHPQYDSYKLLSVKTS